MSNNQNKGMDRQNKAANGETGPMKFRFRGHGYSIPDQENWTIDALLLMAEMEDQPQKAILLVKELLGAGQFEAMKGRHNTVKAFNEFVGVMFAEVEKRTGGEEAPKILNLPGILNRYADELEADFHQFYQLDLLDMYRGKLAPMKVLRLLVRLPRESRFVRAVGGASHEWGTEAYLLAQAVDLLAGGNYQRGGGKGRRPKPVPRPADSKKPLGGKHTRKVSQRQVQNFFASRKAVADEDPGKDNP